MRTKALLCAAGLLAVGAVSAMAQSNVYSLNVVGYVNVSLTNGFQMMANQLDLDGNQTNNTRLTVFGTNLPVASAVYGYSPASGYAKATYLGGTTWSGNNAGVDASLATGRGVWVQIPGTSGTSVTITEVGNVIQGSNPSPFVAGFNLLSINHPVSVGLQTVAGYTPTAGDVVYLYNNPGGYVKKTFLSGTTWTPAGEPVPAVAQPFWLQAKTSGTWTQNFTVQ